MITPPLILECFEFKRRLDGGFSKPFLFAAMDKNDNEYNVVVKLKNPDSGNNHFGATSLACELICSIILRLLNLATPDYAIASVNESVALSVPIERDRKLLLANKGKNFGTLFHTGATTWFPNAQTRLNDNQYDFIEDVITFDSSTINGDRKIDKPNILDTGKEQFLIDHSLALPVFRGSNRSIDHTFLFPETYVKEHCGFKPLGSKINNTINSFEFTKLLSKWDISLSNEQWKSIRDFIPSSWEENPGELDRIFAFLQKRQESFDQISESLRSIIK